MKYDEVWSYPIDRISEYFESRGAVSRGSTCSVSNCSIDDVEIQLIALEERIVGPISLPQTRVVLEGENADQVYRDFYLHFLSGGA